MTQNQITHIFNQITHSFMFSLFSYLWNGEAGVFKFNPEVGHRKY